jgi:membrane-bound lytic murein transglycosylase D
VLRDKLDYRPAISNAFSHAISIGPLASKAPSVKKSAFPALPNEENTPRVRAFLRKYAYEQRNTTKTYLSSLGPYLPMLKQQARDNGLPEEMSYLVMLESGSDPEARSPANALGMWQFMPATARSYGLRVDRWVDERLDPTKSTRAAMLYLKDLYGMFGCWRLAISGYNSGENKLNQVLCQEDAQEYHEICSSRRLKRETKEFFPKFLALTIIAKDPSKYGFSPIPENQQEEKYEQVSIRGSYSLETLAKAAGVHPERLAQLNPSLVRGMTPPEGAPHSLRLPIGTRGNLLTKLDRVPEEKAKTHLTHIVTRGDNVLRILKRYKVSKTQLAKANPDLNLRRKLPQGTRIVVPLEKAPDKNQALTGRMSKAINN